MSWNDWDRVVDIKVNKSEYVFNEILYDYKAVTYKPIKKFYLDIEKIFKKTPK